MCRGIFSNPFFLANSSTLLPLLIQGAMEWGTSNTFQESENENIQAFGYVRREAGDALATWCAYLIAGREWAQEVAILQTDHFYAEQESVAEWAQE